MSILSSVISEVKSLKSDSGFRVYVNPTKRELRAILNKTEYGEMRGAVTKSGDLYVWDAGKANHGEATQDVGIRNREIKVEFFISNTESVRPTEWARMKRYNDVWAGAYNGRNIDPMKVPELKKLLEVPGRYITDSEVRRASRGEPVRTGTLMVRGLDGSVTPLRDFIGESVYNDNRLCYN